VASGVITIGLSDTTPENQPPTALAYPLPYKGTLIVVFYDRVKKMVEPATVPSLLTYTLVHEITHILQGIDGHPASGSDFDGMFLQRLGVAKEDVDLIYLGIEAREACRAAANATPSPIAAR
jgi:hypothetical protein